MAVLPFHSLRFPFIVYWGAALLAFLMVAVGARGLGGMYQNYGALTQGCWGYGVGALSLDDAMTVGPRRWQLMKAFLVLAVRNQRLMGGRG